jgi:hypothetical protein
MSLQFQVASRITGQPNLVRPKVGGGIVNTDVEGYHRALSRVRVSEKSKQLEARVEGLESKLDAIIEILRSK